MSAKNDKYQLFDVADYLVDLDDVAGYLELAIEESGDDPAAVPRALGVIARTLRAASRRMSSATTGSFRIWR